MMRFVSFFRGIISKVAVSVTNPIAFSPTRASVLYSWARSIVGEDVVSMTKRCSSEVDD